MYSLFPPQKRLNIHSYLLTFHYLQVLDNPILILILTLLFMHYQPPLVAVYFGSTFISLNLYMHKRPSKKTLDKK